MGSRLKSTGGLSWRRQTGSSGFEDARPNPVASWGGAAGGSPCCRGSSGLELVRPHGATASYRCVPRGSCGSAFVFLRSSAGKRRAFCSCEGVSWSNMRVFSPTSGLVPGVGRLCASESKSGLPFRVSPAALSWLTTVPPAATSRQERVSACPLIAWDKQLEIGWKFSATCGGHVVSRSSCRLTLSWGGARSQQDVDGQSQVVT